MKYIIEKFCGEVQNTYLMFKIFYLDKRAFYEIMWKNIIEEDSPRMSTW
jgi:hypothetical protein